MIHQQIRGMPCTYAISSRSKNDVNVSRKIAFNPLGNGASVWDDLEADGTLQEDAISTSPKTSYYLFYLFLLILLFEVLMEC